MIPFVKNLCIDKSGINTNFFCLSIIENITTMSHYKYTEREILSIMNFAGFTRKEAIDYLNDLTEMENKMIFIREQESKALEQLVTSFNSNNSNQQKSYSLH